MTYNEVEPGVWDFNHTGVPANRRGPPHPRYAVIVVKAALEHAKAHNIKLATPSCSYVRDNFLKNNPEYKELLIQQ